MTDKDLVALIIAAGSGLAGVALGIVGTLIASSREFNRNKKERRMDYQMAGYEILWELLDAFSAAFLVETAAENRNRHKGSKTADLPNSTDNSLIAGDKISVTKIKLGVLRFAPDMSPRLDKMFGLYKEWIELQGNFTEARWTNKEQTLIDGIYLSMIDKMAEIRAVCLEIQSGLFEHIHKLDITRGTGP